MAHAAAGQTYTIKTFAGGGLPDNIPALAASFPQPQGVAADAAGNAFFSSGNAVFRLDAATGVLTLAAGNGTFGYTGDSGPATEAQLWGPVGVAVDTAGNLYIADNGNNAIREVSGGVITTVAGNGNSGLSGDGGPAVEASLNSPSGIAIDTAGNLYIADSGNGLIRMVSAGVITTVAGGGSSYPGDNGPATGASLTDPTAVAVSTSGNLYIADSSDNLIRQVSSGVITTVAGDGNCCFTGDNGPATDASLDQPSGVAVDSAGNIYILDYFGNRIREVSNGVISTVAGNGVRGFSGDNGAATNAKLSGPAGIAVDAAGNLYISDQRNSRIRKVSSGVIATVAGDGTPGVSGDNGPATAGQLNTPYGVAVDNAGSLYIADWVANNVRKVSNGVITTLAGNGTAGFSGDNGPAAAAQLNSPYGIATDTSGNLYIADWYNDRIREVSNGVIGTFAGNGATGYTCSSAAASDASFNQPEGIALDKAGNLYIADASNNCVREVSNGMVSTVEQAGLDYPAGVAVDALGNLYIADAYNSRIVKVANGIVTTVAGSGDPGFSGDGGPSSGALLSYAAGVAVDSLGNLYIADSGNYVIRMVSNGVITTIAGNGACCFSGDNGPATSASLGYFTSGLAVDASFNVYLNDPGNGRVRILIPSGPPCAAALVSPASLSAPSSGGSLSVTVNAGASCAWAVQGLPGWVGYSGSAVGTGTQTITFTLTPNSGANRSAVLSIAGSSVTVAQQGL
jgi:sugar lactone lactonase YvrE